MNKQHSTQLLSAHNPQHIAKAGALLRQGQLVAIPTETVYGLAANALNSTAVAKIFAAKGRPQDNPLIVHIADMAMLATVVQQIPPQAIALAQHFWPGPLTMVLPKASTVPSITSGGLATVAVRMPSHPAALAVIQAAGLPLAAPSANTSGSPSPTKASHCMADMGGKIPAILDGGSCTVGVESTVLSLMGEHPVILRPGAITLEDVQALLPTTVLHQSALEDLQAGTQAASPGMKYKHYAPKAKVILLNGSMQQYASYVAAHAQVGDCALCFTQDIPNLHIPYYCYGSATNPLQQAQSLFDALRSVDTHNPKTVWAHAPGKEGMALAVHNRLLRACGFHSMELED